MLTAEQFLKHLRDALNHLYDPDRLRQSPLAAILGVADRFDTPSALQHILTASVESLKPPPGDPSRAHNRRIYDLLQYRYVQQFSQQEVANQLGVSVRHLRREQHAALEALAYHLWEQFDLEAKLPEGEEAEIAAGAAEASPTINDELAWLKDAPPDRYTDLYQTLPAVLELTQPMAAQHRTCVETDLVDGLPNLAVHPVALRQALLNLLTVAIGRASGGRIVISASPLRWEVEVQVRCAGVSGEQPHPDDEDANLNIARQLAELCRSRLMLSAEEGAFGARLIFPALERLPVLVIDDNVDTIQLMQRYTSGTRYHLIGTQDPGQALALVEKLSPQIIVLDVMMPQVDGWEILGRLRQHPLTSHVAIIVCTILAQEELALSLGASSFVRKPITRQAFLAALDQQIALGEPPARPHR